jgi:Holliday junction DNA helicase RuvA
VPLIDYVRGTLAEKHPTHVVVEQSGIGYRIQIPLSSYTHLGEMGSEVKLLTHHHIREDTEDLYGFATTAERTLFQLLIEVSGIGPKLAQTILSGMAATALRNALVAADHMALTRIPGVGKKTAERMVLELKDKVAGMIPAGTGADVVPAESAPDDEAVRALVTLGYNRFEAQQAVSRIRKSGENLPVEEIIRAAIQTVR